MGMSASQARLLSITSRLTNNEFRAQTITNSKLRLATESETASQKYMDALDSKQLMFLTYDNDGNSSKVSLTPAVLFDYASMKNQYSLTNAAGKILVSSQDAKNFENSDNLEEFLRKYNLVDNNNAYKQYLADLDKYEVDKVNYQAALIEYQNSLDNYDVLKAQYDEQIEVWENEKIEAKRIWKEETVPSAQQIYSDQIKEIESADPNRLAQRFADTVGKSNVPESEVKAPHCYWKAVNENDNDCFIHLLNAILTKGYTNNIYPIKPTYIPTDLTTSTGRAVTLSNDLGNIGNIFENYNGTTDEQRNMFDEVYEVLNDTENVRYVDGADIYTPEYNNDQGFVKLEGNILQDAYNAGKYPTELDELRSDYYVNKDNSGKPIKDENGNIIYNKKTLKQKTVDLYYIISNIDSFVDGSGNSLLSNDDRRQMLIGFVEGDLRRLSDLPDYEEPQYVDPQYHGINEPKKPVAPVDVSVEPEEPTCCLKITDKEKGQWYVNLWYKMNGGETADIVRKVDDQNAGYIEFNVDNMDNMLKNKNKTNYAVLDDNLLKSSEWLEFALEHGIVSFEKATYYNPAETGIRYATIKKDAISWEAMPYSSATDIMLVDDEKAIAIAEVTYKKTITEIENQDKKFDQDLKKLDTEHNALQTEYESIKEVISKNTERSFKAFS